MLESEKKREKDDTNGDRAVAFSEPGAAAPAGRRRRLSQKVNALLSQKVNFWYPFYALSTPQKVKSDLTFWGDRTT